MPSPVDALPCGSRSTISTSSPIAASAVPRLIAVVVLPTPPFWLATARTRGGLAASANRAWSGAEKSCIDTAASVMGLQPLRVRRNSGAHKIWFALRLGCANHHDPRLWISATRNERGLNAPTFSCFGQFNIHILSLREQALGAAFQQRICDRKQFRQWRDSSRGHRIDIAAKG